VLWLGFTAGHAAPQVTDFRAYGQNPTWHQPRCRPNVQRRGPTLSDPRIHRHSLPVLSSPRALRPV